MVNVGMYMKKMQQLIVRAAIINFGLVLAPTRTVLALIKIEKRGNHLTLSSSVSYA
jgi:hypothetical protein